MILLVPFLALAILVIITPGPDMALVTRNALRGGRRAALLTTLGIVSGLLVWTLASAVGVAVLLEANAFAFTALRLAGAAYLAYLGIRALVTSWRHQTTPFSIPENRFDITRMNSSYAQGFVNNVLNPKIAIFFTSLIPQFITPGPSVAFDSTELAAIFAIMGLAWLTAFSIVAGSTRSVLKLPRVKQWLDRATGVALVALGVRVAMESR